MTLAFNPLTNWYDLLPPGGGGGPIPPVVIPPLLPPYDPTWAYDTGDYVISADIIWEALAPSTGVLPGTNPLIWAARLPGPAVLPPYIPVYDIAYAYDAGRYVMMGDKIWLSLGPSTSVVPGTDPALWRQVLDIPVIPVWDAGYPYLAGQYVMFADHIYISLVPSTGVQPDTDPLSWMWVMEKPYLGEWDATYPYLTDQMVNSAGILYKALAPSTGLLPAANPLAWAPVLDDTAHRFLGEWDVDYEYNQGQWVNDAGLLYRSLVNNNLGNTPAISPVQWQLMISDTQPVHADIIVTVAGQMTYPILVAGIPTVPTNPLKTLVNLTGVELYYGSDFTIAGASVTLLPSGIFNTLDSGWLMRLIIQ